jgi:hypothetical protein
MVRNPAPPRRTGADGQPRIAPLYLEEDIGDEHLLAIIDFGDIQQAEAHCDFIGFAPGIRAVSCDVATR